MAPSWENLVLYRRILRIGGVWNLLASVPVVFLVPSLPGMLEIEPPEHPIFIYFNLVTVMLFGCIQFYVASRLESMRGMMKILMWSKMLTAGVFGGALLFLDMPDALVGFLAPGMGLDLGFGLVYLRYLFYSSATP